MTNISVPHVSAANLAHYLSGSRGQSSAGILQLIDELPEYKYQTMAEFMKAGRVE